MLEQMRRNSRNIVIYVLFGILITVFIISFGPQSGQQTTGCMPQSAFALKIGKREVPESSWRYAMLATGGANMSGDMARRRRIRETVMDGLIQRELLAQAAANAGFSITDEEVDERIAKGEFYVMGQRQPGQLIYFDENGIFDYERLEGFSKQLGYGSQKSSGVDGFRAEQKREMLAQKYRDLITASVRVSPDEVLSRYQQEHSSVSIEFVKLEPRKYKKDLVLTDAEIDAYVTAHEKELKEQFERDKNLYSGGGKWVQLRQIYIKSEKVAAAPAEGEVPTEIPQAPPAAGGAAELMAPPTPPKPPEPDMPDPARATANAALSRLKGGEDFAQVARALSQDERTARRGGLADWGRLTALGWGPEVTKVVETLEPGKPSDVIDVPGGYVVVKVESRSDADLTYDQIKRDLGYEAAVDAKAKELAKKDADEAFAKAQAGAALDTLFERGDDTPEDDADAEGADPAADPAAAPKKDPLAPAAGAKPPAPAAPAAAKSKAAKLFQSGEIHRAGTTVNGSGPTGYVGKSAELAKAVFEQVAVGQLAPKVYDVDDGFVIFKVVDKQEPDMAAFDKEKAKLAEQMAAEKAYGVIDGWNQQRCTEARTGGDISINTKYIEYGDVDEKTGKVRPSNYQPCQVAGAGIPGLPPGMVLQ